ncbi:MAG: hypothetical protein RMI91_09090 [Gemmatales bacterium]|nr:hypothetical protein [Gemmatales bacterium]MDW7994794.1 hypothetical protein [Gemmatales bacterium]
MLTQEVLAGSEQERTETAPFRGRGAKIVLFEQLGEEGLRYILGLRSIGQAPTQIGIHQHPVRFAKSFQGLLCFRCRTSPSGQHQTPVRCR